MTTIFFEPEKMCEALNYYKSVLKIPYENEFRILMSRDTHKIITKWCEQYLVGDVSEFMTVAGTKIIFDDDIPIGRFKTFINAEKVASERKTNET